MDDGNGCSNEEWMDKDKGMVEMDAVMGDGWMDAEMGMGGWVIEMDAVTKDG